MFFLIRISNSSFVFILHVPSLSSVGPYIFLSNLLSITSRQFCSVTVIANVSQPYVTVGRIIDLYICSLLAFLASYPSKYTERISFIADLGIAAVTAYRVECRLSV